MSSLESSNFRKILEKHNLKLKIERLLNYSEHVTDETDVSNADLSHSSENQTCRMVTNLNHPTARVAEC